MKGLIRLISIILAAFVLLNFVGCAARGNSACSNCNAKNDKDAKFCTECGEAISVALNCNSCGYENKKGSKFCTSCGSALASQNNNDVESDSGSGVDSGNNGSGNSGDNGNGNSGGSNTPLKCSFCNQTGRMECSACDGTGKVFKKFDDKGNKVMKTCMNPSCTGGKIRCPYCGGDGYFRD